MMALLAVGAIVVFIALTLLTLFSIAVVMLGYDYKDHLDD